MQALILAAGRGSRLGRRSHETPKCLLEIGRRPLAEHQLEALAEAGVAPVGMVVGYCADEVMEVLGIRAEYIRNPRWSTTNSLYSFWLAREWVRDSVLVLNSDTLIHPQILNRLLDEKGDAFAFDSTSGNAREHMKVQVEGGRLVDMSKELAPEDVSGENVGILKFTKETARELFEIAGRLIEDGHEKSWLGSAVREIARTRNLAAVDVAGLPWGEVDSTYDLQHVRTSVLPAIEHRPSVLRRAQRPVTYMAVSGAMGLSMFFGAKEFYSPPPERSWENVPLEGVEQVKLAGGEQHQAWWAIDEHTSATVHVQGPGKVGVDSRILVPEDAGDRIPYVLEIVIDGKLLDWFKQTKQPSSTWQLAGSPVGQRERLNVQLPEGLHTVKVRLAAAQSGRCLLRIKQLATDQED